MGGLVNYTQMFTVVIDKKEHLERYPFQTFDPYVYCLSVLLKRVRGYLRARSGGDAQADVLAESRGKVEDEQIQLAYRTLRSEGDHIGGASYYQRYFPALELIIKKKDQNIAGLQIADLVAYDQKLLTIQENQKPFPGITREFAERMNRQVNRMVNRYGRYMLE